MLETLTIEVTQRCPNRCLYCSTEGSPDASDSLDADTVCRLLTEARELGAVTAAISGGEPTLCPALPDILEHGKRLGLGLRLYSCGVSGTYTPLAEDILDAVRLSRTQLVIGLPSFRASTYRRVTHSAATVREPIETIERARRMRLRVETHLTLIQPTLLQLPTYLECAQALGVAQVSLLRFVPQGRGAAHQELALEGPASARMLAYAAQHPLVRLGAPWAPSVGCSAASRLLVRPDGEVLPCEALKGVCGPLGSVRDSSLHHLWASPSRAAALRALPQAQCPAQALYGRSDHVVAPALC